MIIWSAVCIDLPQPSSRDLTFTLQDEVIKNFLMNAEYVISSRCITSI